MKITKEYLRTIIKEELDKLEEATQPLSTTAKTQLANDIRKKYDSSLTDDEAIQFSDHIGELDKAVNSNLSDSDKQNLANRVSLNTKERNILLKDPNNPITKYLKNIRK